MDWVLQIPRSSNAIGTRSYATTPEAKAKGKVSHSVSYDMTLYKAHLAQLPIL